MDELWNKELTRENITDFYYETVTMVYPSVFDITKETTRAENAIVKSYQDIYAKRESVAGEDVIYVFGDILLKNAKDMVEMYPLPDNLNFAPRLLDEYTRNSMLEKILTKIDSRGFKVAEFISSDSHKQSASPSIRKYMEVFPITPLLIVEVIIVSIIIWLVSLAAIKLPYKNDKIVNEQAVFETNSLQERYMNAMGYYPLNADVSKSFVNADKLARAAAQNSTDPTDVSGVTSATVPSGATGETLTPGGTDNTTEPAEPGEGSEPGETAEPGESEGSEPSATRG